MERVILPGVAKRPGGYTSRVAYLAGAEYRFSRKGVPMACYGPRTACFFGRSNLFALFYYGIRVGFARTTIEAANYLRSSDEPNMFGLD